jgi:alanyl-tRNA synthetase
MAEERGLTIDEAAFEKAKQESYEVSKAGGRSKGKESVKLDVHDLGALEKNDAIPKTDDSAKFRESLAMRVPKRQFGVADSRL